MWRYIWGSFLVWTVLMATKTTTCMNGVSMYVETLHSTVLKSRLYTGCTYMANRASLSPAPILPAGRAPSVERRSHNPKVPSSILGLRMGSFCHFHKFLHILYIISFQKQYNTTGTSWHTPLAWVIIPGGLLHHDLSSAALSFLLEERCVQSHVNVLAFLHAHLNTSDITLQQITSTVLPDLF